MTSTTPPLPDAPPRPGRALAVTALVVGAAAAITCVSPSTTSWLVPAAFVWIPCLLAAAGRTSPERLGLDRPSPSRDGPALAAGLGMVALYASVMALLRGTPSSWDGAGLPLALTLQVLTVGLPEELFFRGYLQGELQAVASPRAWWPALVAAIVFGLAHVAVGRGPAAVVTALPGFLFGLLRRRTGTIWVPVLVHGAANTVHRILPLL